MATLAPANMPREAEVRMGHPVDLENIAEVLERTASRVNKAVVVGQDVEIGHVRRTDKSRLENSRDAFSMHHVK